MGIIGQIIYGLLSAVLPWLFSGKQTDVSSHVTGMNDMDQDTLTRAKNIPLILVALMFLNGCIYGGKQLTVNHIMVDAGGYVEIATDNPIEIQLTKADGTKTIEKRNMAGAYAVPKNVYRELRENWVKRHPEAGLLAGEQPVLAGTVEEQNIVIVAEPVVTGEIMTKDMIDILVLVEAQKKFSHKMLFSWVAMARTTYMQFKEDWDKSHK